jgi:hypothetical protein
MISIINRDCRQIGCTPGQRITVELTGESCKYLPLFKGARLAVFMALALHTNSEGWAIVSLALLRKETGYASDTIASAIARLCRLEIDGHRVLMAVRSSRPAGPHAKYYFRIFPADGDLLRYEGLLGGRRTIGNSSGPMRSRGENLTLVQSCAPA